MTYYDYGIVFAGIDGTLLFDNTSPSPNSAPGQNSVHSQNAEVGMSFTKDLSANVPWYQQQNPDWCGAACVQMIRNGYPNPADRHHYSQKKIWKIIQSCESQDPGDVTACWASDPRGVAGCLQSLNNPPGVKWVESLYVDQNVALFDILYWMNRCEYPCAILVHGGNHWVVIVRFETDVEPVEGSAPTLQSITYYDPQPAQRWIAVTQSYGTRWLWGPMLDPVTYDGSWLGQYVAVLEPRGRRRREEVQMKVEKMTGERLLSPSEALDAARKWVAELKLAEQSQFSLLGRDDVGPLEPVLARDEQPSSHDEEVAHQYYSVPFGSEADSGKHGARTARVCLLVNAYTGELEEVTAFDEPVRYLSKEEVLEIVARETAQEHLDLEGAEATLMFRPSQITQTRAWPFWQVKVGETIVYVDQLGNLYRELRRGRPGS
jgi:hypothetical protein